MPPSNGSRTFYSAITTGGWQAESKLSGSASLSKDLALGIKGTGHHSVIQVPGTDEWYIVYHRFAIAGGDGTHRETAIDRLEFEPDGAIKRVVPTLEGIDPVS